MVLERGSGVVGGVPPVCAYNKVAWILGIDS